MDAPNKQQKEERLEQFLTNLLVDPSILKYKHSAASVALPELMKSCGEQFVNESVDMARLVSILLEKKGIAGSCEDMMDHVISGGTVDEFIALRK